MRHVPHRSSATTNARPAAVGILVADDDALCRTAAATLLRAAGFHVVEAENAFKGLDLLASTPVSLVLSDINMPGNERLAFVHEINRRHTGLPVILFTGFATTETAIESMNSGVVAYLRKPVAGDQLLQAIQRAVGLYEARRLTGRSREHLRQWTDELANLERQLQDPRSAGQTNVVGDLLDVSLRRVVAAIADIRELVDVLTKSPGSVSGLRTHDLERAVRDAIAVLERTKKDFKSKELADLRQRLQAVVESAPATPRRTSG